MLLPIYLPAMLLGIPAQATLVLLPLYVLTLDGGSAAAAAAVVGFRGLGMVLMDIPAGMLAARYGDRWLMLLAQVSLIVGLIGFALSESVVWLYVIALFYGCGASSFLLGRMSYITAVVPPESRGRVIAMIAGSMRACALLGPLIGTALAHAYGYQAAFLGAAALAGASFICMYFFARDEHKMPRPISPGAVLEIALRFRRTFMTAGAAAVVFMVLRAARTVMIPLIGAAIGLDTQTIGLVVSASAMVDVLMFYPAGLVMDKLGRRATAIPSCLMFACALAALAWAHDLVSLTVVALGAGVANGLSTGIVMALGTDLAPLDRRAEFLGLWRLLTDLGTAGGPLLIGAVVAVAPLAAAALSIAAIGFTGSWVIYRYVEETLHTKTAVALE